jgi:hypothetical protein
MNSASNNIPLIIIHFPRISLIIPASSHLHHLFDRALIPNLRPPCCFAYIAELPQKGLVLRLQVAVVAVNTRFQRQQQGEPRFTVNYPSTQAGPRTPVRPNTEPSTTTTYANTTVLAWSLS